MKNFLGKQINSTAKLHQKDDIQYFTTETSLLSSPDPLIFINTYS
jgi:hypothetical protein